MILTTKEQVRNYSAMNPYFKTAFAALEKMQTEPFVKGKHPVDGDNVWIIALEYDTHPLADAKMEDHSNYIDVMWMLSGDEKIGVCNVKEMTDVIMPYDANEDAFLSTMVPDCTYARMKPNSVLFLYPEDGHAPGLDVEGKATVRKLIAKVKVV